MATPSEVVPPTKETLGGILEGNFENIVSLIEDPIGLAKRLHFEEYLPESVKKTVIEDKILTPREKSCIVMKEAQKIINYEDNTRAVKQLNNICDVLRQENNPRLKKLVDTMLLNISSTLDEHGQRIDQHGQRLTALEDAGNPSSKIPTEPGVVSNESSLTDEGKADTADNDPYYTKAIADGSGYLRSAVVVMHGPPGAGKTSVKQLFLGRDPLSPENQNSTDMMVRPIRTCRIQSDGINQLQEVDKEDLQKMLLRSIQDKSDDIRKDTKTDDSHQPSTSTTVNSSDQQHSEIKPQPDTPFVNPPSTYYVHLKNLEQPPPKINSHLKNLAKINSSRTWKQMKQYASTAKSSRNLFNLDWIYMVDSGGQPQFSDVLPLLFQSEALYIVVIRLDQDLDVKQNNCYYTNGNENRLEERLLSTNRQIIERTCQIAQAQNSETSPRRVIVIATHIDEVSNPEERVKEFDKELRNIQTKYDKVFVAKDISSDRIIYPVNAMATGDERKAYIKELQQCLIDTLKKSIKKKEVPLKWFLYQLDLDEESNNTHGVVTKSKCVELGESFEMTAEEIEQSLKFFNTLALHIYHSDMVLIKIDPLIKRLSALIRISFDSPKGVPTYEYTKLKQSGLFNKSLLSTTFANIDDGNAISEDDFLRISECLKVIVHVMNDEYFIPSVLSVDSTKDPIKLDDQLTCIINWGRDHIVLPWFFNTLVVMLLHQKDQQSSQNVFTLPLKKKNFSQSRNRIELDAELHGGVLTLTNEIQWIGIYYSCNKIQCYLKILNIVRQALVEVVTHLWKVLGKLQFTFPSFPCLAKECKDDHQHPACELQFDSEHFQCSLDSRNEFPVTDHMKRIIESVKSLPTEESDGTLTDQENNKTLAKRKHSAISEDESVDTRTPSRKPHCHGKEEDDNMGTRMINKTTVHSSDIWKKSPTLYDANRVLRDMSARWDSLGGSLKVNKDIRERLTYRNEPESSKLETVLNEWMQSHCSPVTWEHLFNVLKDDMKRMDKAAKIEQYLQKDDIKKEYKDKPIWKKI